MKILRFSTNNSLYVANDTRYRHSYYRRRIGNRTRAFEWHSSMTLSELQPRFQGHYVIQCQITRIWYEIELWLQWQTNRESYMVYQTAPFSMILNDPQPSFQGHAVLRRCVSHKQLKIQP